MAHATENNTNTYSLNNDKDDFPDLLLNRYRPLNYTEQKIKYIEFMNSVEMRQTRLCHLFKVFYDKSYYIDYNDTMFIDVFSMIYENPYLTPIDIELYYIKNKCYDKIYESKIILNDTQIRNIILTILFMYNIKKRFLLTITIFMLYHLLF